MSYAVAPAPEITIAADRQTVTVGDPIEYILTVRYDSSLHLIAPVIGRMVGALDVLADTVLAEALIDGNRKTYKRRLRLAAFQTGDLWAPALQGHLVDTAGLATAWQTDSLSFAVASVLGEVDPDSADIKSLKAQFEADEGHWWWWALAFALVALGVYLYLRRRWQRQPETKKVGPPPTPAWESALLALQSLREEIDPGSDGGRLWYFRLSSILRRYFDDRYGWDSIDETTTEVMRRLDYAPFNGGHEDRAREFFRLADLVRYAKTSAKVGRPEIDWDWVRTFVEVTIPSVKPVITTQDPVAATSVDTASPIATETAEPTEPLEDKPE